MSRLPLRRDLQISTLSGNRDCVIVDDIGGRFARIKRAVWDQLCGWSSGQDTVSTEPDASLWQQAVAAGWTENRCGRVAGPSWSLLSIRIPIGSIDPIARRLVRWSGFVYAPRALLFWIIAAIAGLIMIVVRWENWSGSIPSLSAYLQSLHPVSVALLFVITKSVHELGHATACRRLGSRCGVAGIWFLCLMPCPYVDVTEVWRQPNAIRRAAVMASGMIAEGVLCVLAIWAWILSDSPNVQLAAMNIILVCGVSTILFNANPLMRYDGYFILSDLVDSTNLRSEARRAWQRFLTEPLMRWLHLGHRRWALLIYHVAAAVYRLTLVVAIAAMLLGIADRWGAWRLVATVLVAMAGRALYRKMNAGWEMWKGSGFWSAVSSIRRRGLVLLAVAAVVALIGVPMPRYRHVEGQIRSKDAHSVYLPAEGTIDEVNVRVGDQVLQGQCLARLSDPELSLEMAATHGQARVLEHRSRAARLASLQSSRNMNAMSSRNRRQSGVPGHAPESHWDVLDAATRAVTEKVAELQSRQSKLDVLSPADGVILPSGDVPVAQHDVHQNPIHLSPGVGEPAGDRYSWCRVASSNRLQLFMPMNAGDQHDVQIGCPVRFRIPGYDSTVLRSEVSGVSPLHAPDTLESQPTSRPEGDNPDLRVYQAVCDVPEQVDIPIDTLPRWEGVRCEVVVHLPPRPLWKDLWQMVQDIMGI
ncbi:biotin/lipoyl-binding protein [Aporhodopirellula aestuarii]|uniref:Biotin/lipoyl-binding protein n=1 Tax=Aporhodopirellula aestuarii TaxID=2950107 RepID=A0ABT0U4G7_9BACT|nr:biotin/lipoyl-binding protein [Aporhodopirellula aestuarii]MCM2371824.1 biotin/lipoyl-binding protein [Aporhodopirellula aestuarii]